MEKSSKSRIIDVILILSIISTLILSYDIENKISLKKENQLKEKSIYTEKNKLLKEKVQELKELNTTIQEYKNLNESIQNMRKDYYSHIKELEDKILNNETDEKIAYLTFDDGPYYNTYKVLDILDEYNVKATFFTISMNGEYCYDNKDYNCFLLYKEYVKRAHTIANHTYTHGIRTGLYNSVNSFMDAINRQEEHIKEKTEGYITNIVRFPGGSSTAKSLKYQMIDALQEKGYGWVDWTAGNGDGGRLDSIDQAWNNLKNTIDSKIEVILFHDYSQITTAMLPEVIEYLKDNGYQLYPLFYESNMIHK